MYFMIASLVAVAQQILAGLVVDAAGRRVNWVLVTSLVADMGLLAGLFFGTKTGGHYDWVLIGAPPSFLLFLIFLMLILAWLRVSVRVC